MRIHADPDPDPQPCFPSVQPPSCIASLLSSLHPVLFPFCPASILYYFPSVQPQSCTTSLLSRDSRIRPVLPSCPESDCIRPVLYILRALLYSTTCNAIVLFRVCLHLSCPASLSPCVRPVLKLLVPILSCESKL